MKKIWKLALFSVLAFSLVGCGGKGSVEQIMDAEEVYGCNVLNVYNWGEYVGEEVISNFEDMYNAKVNYSLFDSNEAMYTKLLGGSAYDILVPSDYMIERLIEEDLLQEIDKNIVTNLGNLADGVKNLPYDPDNTYSVPYFWGTVGIVYNKENVSEEQLQKEGYNIFLDEQYKDRVFLYDSERDSFMMAFKALGYSMNTEDQDEIQAAYEWLLDVNEAVNPAFVTDEVIDAMVNGEKDLAIMYSGDAAYVLNENEDMGFFLPNEGTNIWSDAMVIPANSKCPGLANEFINYMLTYDAAYDNSSTVGYTSTNKEVMDGLSVEYDEDAYVPRTDNPKDEVFKHNDVLKKQLTDLWIKVKNH